MNENRRQDTFPPLTIEQIRDLAAAVREDFGGNLSRVDFTESLLMLLEDVPEFEGGEVPPSLIESTWGEYNHHRFES